MKVADLFCGMGGFSEGFKQAGYDIVYANDNEKECCEIFKANNPDTEVVCKDIRKITEVPKVDIVVGSPPCQPFSIASYAKSYDTTFVDEFFRLVKLFEAKYWIMENVVHLNKFIEQKGVVLDASEFGVPQKRRREFFSNILLRPEKTFKVTVAQALKLKKGSYMLDSRMAHFNEGEREPIDVDKPAPTLTTKCNGLHIIQPFNKFMFEVNTAKSIREWVMRYEKKPVHLRRISTNECMILQGFPLNYEFPKNMKDTRKYTYIGNSVCPPLSNAIAKNLEKDIGGSINSWM